MNPAEESPNTGGQRLTAGSCFGCHPANASMGSWVGTYVQSNAGEVLGRVQEARG